jgi:hypothetical protein
MTLSQAANLLLVLATEKQEKTYVGFDPVLGYQKNKRV